MLYYVSWYLLIMICIKEITADFLSICLYLLGAIPNAFHFILRTTLQSRYKQISLILNCNISPLHFSISQFEMYLQLLCLIIIVCSFSFLRLYTFSFCIGEMINTALVSWQRYTAGTYCWVKHSFRFFYKMVHKPEWTFFFLPSQSMCVRISSFKCGDSYIKSKFRLFYFVVISDNFEFTLKKEIQMKTTTCLSLTGKDLKVKLT